ncbi:hypothetical protein KC19_2G284100 [Ceratodon purpureus]|uniref:Uncharacterized protein n=1 Tax=Ceratodon purpureus TaxID=3225 RepID=A0A8T0J0G1_CERPU|nr:hypothetical protein KC19_2G284100 [Ceratodon purpureus]
MGGVCAGCFRGQEKEENGKYARYEAPQFAQHPPVQPQQQQPRPQPKQKKTSEEERAQSEEARSNAAIAAQKRLEAFEKSAGGKAAKKAIAAAKAPPPSRDNRDDVAKDWAN